MRRPIANWVCWLGAVGLIALAVDLGYAYLEVREARHRITRDMEKHAAVLSRTLGHQIEGGHIDASPGAVKRLLAQLGGPGDRIKVFDRLPVTAAVTPEVAPPLSPISARLNEAMAGAVSPRLISFDGTPVFVHATPLPSSTGPDGKLLVLLDASPLKQAEHAIWISHAVRFAARAVLVCLAVLVVVWIIRNATPTSGAHPMLGFTEPMHERRFGFRRFSALTSGMAHAAGGRSR